jgi:hypothetical protein
LQKKKEIKVAVKTTNIKDTQAKDIEGFKALFKNEVHSQKN